MEIDQAREEIELKLSFLQKVSVSTKAYTEKKTSNGDNMISKNFSNMISNKLTKDDMKFIEKQLLKLNEYPTEWRDIIYLLKRGVEKIGIEKQSTQLNKTQNTLFRNGVKASTKLKKKLSKTSHTGTLHS